MNSLTSGRKKTRDVPTRVEQMPKLLMRRLVWAGKESAALPMSCASSMTSAAVANAKKPMIPESGIVIRSGKCVGNSDQEHIDKT